MVKSFRLVVSIKVVFMLVISSLELEDYSKNASDYHEKDVNKEGPFEAIESVVLNLLVEKDFIGETASKHGDTSNKSIRTEESSEVNNNMLVEFP